MRRPSLLVFCSSLVFGALTCLKYFSNDILGSFGSSIRSQRHVVAKHEDTGSCCKTNRQSSSLPMTLPHTNFLVESPVEVRTSCTERYWVVWLQCLLLHLFSSSLPSDPVRVTLLDCCYSCSGSSHPVALSVATIARAFCICTISANNNKSSVAALLRYSRVSVLLAIVWGCSSFAGDAALIQSLMR